MLFIPPLLFVTVYSCCFCSRIVHHTSREAHFTVSPVNAPKDSHILWYDKAILHFIFFICIIIVFLLLWCREMRCEGGLSPKSVVLRCPHPCNASLVHCHQTNISAMFAANKLLYFQAIWCWKRQRWRSGAPLNGASGSVREWFIWNYCSTVLFIDVAP